MTWHVGTRGHMRAHGSLPRSAPTAVLEATPKTSKVPPQQPLKFPVSQKAFPLHSLGKCRKAPTALPEASRAPLTAASQGSQIVRSATPALAEAPRRPEALPLQPQRGPEGQERSYCSPRGVQKARSAPTAVPEGSRRPGALPLQSQKGPEAQERSHSSFKGVEGKVAGWREGGGRGVSL